MKSILVIFTFLAMASATAIKPEDFQEPKFIVNNVGSNFVALNSTLLWAGVLALGAVALVALALSGGFSAARIQERYGQKYEDTFSSYSDYAHNRYRRFASNGNTAFN